MFICFKSATFTQNSVVKTERLDLESQKPGEQFQMDHLLAAQSWARY